MMLSPDIEISQTPTNISQEYIEYVFPDPAFITLSSGNKRLLMSVVHSSPGTGDNNLYASTRIDNVQDAQVKPGATTALYKRAREILQSLADSSQQTVNYSLSTSNPNMLNWAMDPEKGVEIFDWKNITISRKGKVEFSAEIKPQA